MNYFDIDILVWNINRLGRGDDRLDRNIDRLDRSDDRLDRSIDRKIYWIDRLDRSVDRLDEPFKVGSRQRRKKSDKWKLLNIISEMMKVGRDWQ